MLKLFLCLITGFLVAQNSPAFYIERVGVNTEYNADYILSYANQIVPPDKQVTNDDIKCLLEELKASGMFQDIEVNLLPAERKDVYQLVLTPTYRPHSDSLVINDIQVEGMPEINEAAFWSELNKRGIKRGTNLWKYPFGELKEKMGAALSQVYPHNSLEDEIEIEAPWTAIRLIGDNEVKLILSPAYSGCSNSAK